MMVDVLSQKAASTGSLAYLRVSRKPLARENQTLASQFIFFDISKRGGVLASIEVRSIFLNLIKARQFEGEKLNKLQNKIVCGKTSDATLDRYRC